MNESPIEAFGPPPFRFVPTHAGHAGAAFSLTFKLIASVIVFGAAGWLASLWQAGALGSGGRSGTGWFAASLAIMLWTWWHIMASRTRLEADALHQTWIWELAYGKLIRIRGLDWLIAPRLYVRTLLGKFAVFYAADPVLIADFERLVKELAAFRRPG
jgi:hypothetical protein